MNMSALTKHFYRIPVSQFNTLPFHTRGLLRMVPQENVVHVLILAALIDDDLQVMCTKKVDQISTYRY